MPSLPAVPDAAAADVEVLGTLGLGRMAFEDGNAGLKG